MEAMIISGSQVYNHEEGIVLGFRSHTREAIPAHCGRTNANFGSHTDILCDGLGNGLVSWDGRVHAFAVLFGSRACMRSARIRVRTRRLLRYWSRRAGRRGSGCTEEFVETVLNAVDLSKMFVVDLFHLIVRELDRRRGRAVRTSDAEQCIERVRAALDLFDTPFLDDTEM